MSAIIIEPVGLPVSLSSRPGTAAPLSAVRRVVLTGFMGAGKSTVGALLAARLNWRFIDVDQAIEERAGMPVAQIFATLGEFIFRRLETSAIAHALGEQQVILALGGGAPEVLANRLLLEQTPGTAVILLEAAFDVLAERCASQTGPAAARPNFVDRSTAAERFQYRAPLYRRIARRRIATAGQTPQQTATAVLEAAGLASMGR